MSTLKFQNEIQSEVVIELLETGLPHQRVLLGLLAIADRHHADPVPLLLGLASELPTRYGNDLRYFADQIRSGENAVDFLDALEFVPRLLPPSNRLALQLARESGSLPHVFEELLIRTPEPETVDLPGPNESFSAKNIRLLIRAFVMFSIIAFVMLKIVPEFEMMLAEFDVEVGGALLLLNQVTNRLVSLIVFVPVLLLCLLPFFLPALMRYLRRWNPLTWRRRYRTPSVERRRMLALIAGMGPTLTTGINKIENIKPLQKLFRRTDRVKRRIEQGENEWASLAAENIISRDDAKALSLSQGRDTQAWLLRWSAENQQHHRETRIAFFGRLFLSVVNIGLGLMVVLICLAVISTLLNIMAELVKG